jgi:hypothetical protein
MKHTPPHNQNQNISSIAQNAQKTKQHLGCLGEPLPSYKVFYLCKPQRESLLPILRVEPTTFHFGLDNFQEFYRKEGELTDWATLTRLLRKEVFGENIWI